MSNQRTKRIVQLTKLDMKYDLNEITYFGTNDFNKNFNVHFIETQCDADIVWDGKIKLMEKVYHKRKITKDLIDALDI